MVFLLKFLPGFDQKFVTSFLREFLLKFQRFARYCYQSTPRDSSRSTFSNYHKLVSEVSPGIYLKGCCGISPKFHLRYASEFLPELDLYYLSMLLPRCFTGVFRTYPGLSLTIYAVVSFRISAGAIVNVSNEMLSEIFLSIYS